jgi:peptidoglycan/xylan/chitin deacetylase (PgdA/CDA1 family)/Iap family predicted aminopeptidase
MPGVTSTSIRFLSLFLFLLLTVWAHPTWGAGIAPDEREFLDRLDVDRALRETRRVSQEIVSNRSGAGVGSVVAGSADERRLADHVARSLRKLGLEVRRQTFPVRFYDYAEPKLIVGGRRVAAVSLYTTLGTYGVRDGSPYFLGNLQEGQVMEADLADVGLGTRADYDRVGDVRGKAVLIQRDDDETGWPNVILAEAAARGAVAALLYGCTSDTPLPDALKQDSVQYQDDIPAVSVSRNEAARIKEALAAGGATTITLEARVEVREAESQNVIGRLEGKGPAAQRVAFGAHLDRWFTGAQDNSVGIGMLLELARAFAPAGPRERAVEFIAWGAEEAGGAATLVDWLNGSYFYARSPDAGLDSLVLYLNLDGAGWSNRDGTVYTSPEATEFFRRAVTDLDLAERLQVRAGLSTWVDAWCLGGIRGVSSAYMQWRKGYLGGKEEIRFLDYYHTDADRFDASLLENLHRDLELMALAAYRVSRASPLPYDFGDTARWLAESLEADAARTAAVDFKPALAAAVRMERATREGEARLDDAAQIRLRDQLYPELVYSVGYLATPRPAYLAERLQHLEKASAALSKSDLDGARQALGAILESGRHLGVKAYRESRRRYVEMVSWNVERGQLAPLPPKQVYRAFRMLEGEPAEVEIDAARAWIDRARATAAAQLELAVDDVRRVALAAASTLEAGRTTNDEGPDPRAALEIDQARRIIAGVEPGRDLTPMTWPTKKRVAVGLTFDLDAELAWMADPAQASPDDLSRGRYGPRAGLPRILALLERHGIPATFFLPALQLELHPEAVASIRSHPGHEIGFHGYAHEGVTTLSAAEERRAMSKGLDLFRKADIEPGAYRSPSWEFSTATLGLLREFGFNVDSSLMGDDRPYEILSHGEPTGIVELPIDWSLDDWVHFQIDWDYPLQATRDPAQVLAIWKGEFDAIRQEGGVFVLTMHPQVIGRPGRIAMLEQLIEHIESGGDAWFASLGDIAAAATLIE